VKPVLALVGRPNVGKSTLFNRLTRSRDAIVHDLPGVTRDRHYGEGRAGERRFIAIDTGGFEPRAQDGLPVRMARQAEQAIAEADAVVFVVDGRAGRAPLALLDARALPLVLRGLAFARPRTVRVPAAGTNTDCSPVAHRTVIMRPRTSVTTPLRVAWLTFVATT